MRSPAESKILLNILWCYKFTTAFDCYEITLSLFYSCFFGLSLIYALITCPYSCRDTLNFEVESDFMNISSTYIFKSKSGLKSFTMNYSQFFKFLNNFSNRYFLKKFKVQLARTLVRPVVWCKLVEPGRCGRLKTCTLCAAQSRLASKTIILLKFSSPQTPRKFKLTQNFGK